MCVLRRQKNWLREKERELNCGVILSEEMVVLGEGASFFFKFQIELEETADLCVGRVDRRFSGHGFYKDRRSVRVELVQIEFIFGANLGLITAGRVWSGRDIFY